ncbi:cell division protein ZapE [Rhizobium sp. SSA_523]|uniref:cell division protein ZapE n=1 Tax=Rhizobium sp. SSA_523 TaxID=2952477 RepID=UPI0020913FDF|nr:cell division protein ZapE [Rhizobium sp. SSA_523]MCO5733585.1 cell division protein ZapE [Rhizobium sp. SSA_523]WKC23118.1 cell division protein ZapE [Rhizobium sp. SSA_523]
MAKLPDYNNSVSDELVSLTASGALQMDKAQMAVAAKLDHVLAELRERVPAKKTSALGWLFAKRNKRNGAAIRGLYIHGSVGRGKTMLMDMFFAKANVARKRRCHFHEFMADVHGRIHAHRQKLKAGETKQADPVPPVAAALFAEAELLCFDEFSVTDIADAMILGRLFTELFELGCVLVTTSNVAPDNLYRDGLNRSLFLPFIALLKRYVDVTSLDSPTDYRMEKLASLPVYLTPLGGQTEISMENAWHQLTDGAKCAPMEIPRKGRSIAVPCAAGRAARFQFSDLCEKPLGAADYLEIAARFDLVFVENVPLIGPDKRNQTKRFINLIDAFYDKSVRVFISAAAPPDDLLTEKRGTEGFEFDRTISRLFEMRSADYLAAHKQKRADL